MSDTRITNLRQLLASVHSAATDIDECIANSEAHATILEDHLCKIINHLIKFKPPNAESLVGAGESCLGTCANCAWPLYLAKGSLMHFEISYQLGNKCYLPKLGNGGHS